MVENYRGLLQWRDFLFYDMGENLGWQVQFTPIYALGVDWRGQGLVLEEEGDVLPRLLSTWAVNPREYTASLIELCRYLREKGEKRARVLRELTRDLDEPPYCQESQDVVGVGRPATWSTADFEKISDVFDCLTKYENTIDELSDLELRLFAETRAFAELVEPERTGSAVSMYVVYIYVGGVPIFMNGYSSDRGVPVSVVGNDELYRKILRTPIDEVLPPSFRRRNREEYDAIAEWYHEVQRRIRVLEKENLLRRMRVLVPKPTGRVVYYGGRPAVYLGKKSFDSGREVLRDSPSTFAGAVALTKKLHAYGEFRRLVHRTMVVRELNKRAFEGARL